MRRSKIPDDRIALSAELACFLEASSEKPGNVTPTRSFSNLRFEHFLLGGAVIGHVLRTIPNESVGKTIHRMASETIDLCGTNVNLGIILLFVPLAKILRSQGRLTKVGALRILHGLTVRDAEWAYSAIRKTRPAGMGKLNSHDFRRKPRITLFRAMELAKDRDSVAREYATGFSILRTIAYPFLRTQIRSGLGAGAAVVQTYLYLLSRVPDTLIIRKRDEKTAGKISQEAASIMNSGGVRTGNGRRRIAEFDKKLRTSDHSLNPGTTADLVAAALFVYLAQNGFHFLKGSNR
jgi:triphosphoribosyl-dephospho-CoA synthase